LTEAELIKIRTGGIN